MKALEAFKTYKIPPVYTPFQVYKAGFDACLEILPKKRSSQQNRYYWGCPVDIIAKWSGYTKDEVHELNKNMLPYPHRRRIEQCSKMPDRMPVSQYTASTKDMTKKEFSDWLEFTVFPAWQEQGCGNIPLPNETQMWESYIKESEII